MRQVGDALGVQTIRELKVVPDFASDAYHPIRGAKCGTESWQMIKTVPQAILEAEVPGFILPVLLALDENAALLQSVEFGNVGRILRPFSKPPGNSIKKSSGSPQGHHIIAARVSQNMARHAPGKIQFGKSRRKNAAWGHVVAIEYFDLVAIFLQIAAELHDHRSSAVFTAAESRRGH